MAMKSPECRSAASAGAVPPASGLDRILGFMSVATMVMTLPQVHAVWFDTKPGGVSLLSWAPICCRPACGSSTACASGTRPSTWPASVGSCSTSRSSRERALARYREGAARRVMRHARHQGRKRVLRTATLAPGRWGAPVNLFTGFRSRNYLTTFRGLSRPWEPLQAHYRVARNSAGHPEPAPNPSSVRPCLSSSRSAACSA